MGLAFYRIAQESLANIAKHAPEAESSVLLRISRTSATLTVTNRLPVGRSFAVRRSQRQERPQQPERRRSTVYAACVNASSCSAASSVWVPPTKDGRSARTSHWTTPIGHPDGVPRGVMTDHCLRGRGPPRRRSGSGALWLRRILRRKDGFTIVAECADGDEVPDAVDPLPPGRGGDGSADETGRRDRGNAPGHGDATGLRCWR